MSNPSVPPAFPPSTDPFLQDPEKVRLLTDPKRRLLRLEMVLDAIKFELALQEQIFKESKKIQEEMFNTLDDFEGKNEGFEEQPEIAKKISELEQKESDAFDDMVFEEGTRDAFEALAEAIQEIISDLKPDDPIT